jgi:hypothetical protein
MSACFKEVVDEENAGFFLQYAESWGSMTLKYCRGIGIWSNSTCLVSQTASSQIRSPFGRSNSCVRKIAFDFSRYVFAVVRC